MELPASLYALLTVYPLAKPHQSRADALFCLLLLRFDLFQLSGSQHTAHFLEKIGALHGDIGLDSSDFGLLIANSLLVYRRGLDDSTAAEEAISTGGGISRPRPLASSSRCTASGLNASAPMP